MDGSWGMDGDRMGEHGRWVHGVKTYLSKFTCFGGQYVLGFELPRHQNVCWATHWNFTYLMGGKFWVSSFKMRDFWAIEIDVGLPPKHDMFLCRFA
jgi:hypothetical protein